MGTISYNTKAFLDKKLNDLLSANVIDDYRYIKHQGEDGDKDHFHVWVMPNGQRDFGDIRDVFNEIDVTQDKPLRCMPFRHSEPLHWIMYALHDPIYLANHESDNDGDGKIPYALQDIETPYPEQLERDFKKALSLRETTNQKVLNDLQSGLTAYEIAYKQAISPQQIQALQKMYREFKAMALEKQAETETRLRRYITPDGEFVEIPEGFEPEWEQIRFEGIDEK